MGVDSFKTFKRNNKMGSFRKSRFKDKKEHYQTSGTLQSPKVVQTEEEKATSRAKVKAEIAATQKQVWFNRLITVLFSIVVLWILYIGIESFLLWFKSVID